MRTRVKICGITCAEDAVIAAMHGCDAIGLVFYRHSTRYISPQKAAEIVAGITPFVSVAGLFVNASASEIQEVMQQVRLDILQFHGDESPAECASYGMPYMKAIRVKADTNLLQYAQSFEQAKALLLDTYVKGKPGGTGEVFDWGLIPHDALPLPIILAGGLTVENVASAIKTVRPYAVDVSGGVENKKGIKDAAKIAAFMQGVVHAGL